MTNEFFNFAKTNPFFNADVMKMYGDFDPSKFADEFAKATNGMKVPAFDVNAIVDAQRKNIEAFSAANRAAVEGFQTVAKRQAEMVKAAIDDMSAAVATMGKTTSPAEVTAKQAELAKETYETVVANLKEISDILAKSNDVAAKTINARVIEAMDEMKSVAPTKSAKK